MMDDIRKILEAVASGEITPEEGEMLIKALKEREGKEEKKEKKEREEKKREKETGFVVEDGEVIEEDLFLSGENVLIAGKVKGDLTLLNCNTKFSGEIEGDMVVIGGKIEFDGGKVKEDLVLIGARYSGSEPEIGGDFVKITNFLASGILMALSPILKGLKIRSGKKQKSMKMGSGSVEWDSKQEKLVIPEGANTSVGFIECEELIVDGNLMAVAVKAESVTVNGRLEVKTLAAETVRVNGFIKANVMKCESLLGNGEVDVDILHAEHIDENVKILR